MAKHIPDEAESYKKHVQPEKWVAMIAFLMQALMDGHALNDRLLRRVEGRCTWMLFDHRASCLAFPMLPMRMNHGMLKLLRRLGLDV